jgi:hypothetical protein
VIWGDPYRGMTQVLVRAHDADEAMVRAHELRPDLPRPKVALLSNDVEISNGAPVVR